MVSTIDQLLSQMTLESRTPTVREYVEATDVLPLDTTAGIPVYDPLGTVPEKTDGVQAIIPPAITTRTVQAAPESRGGIGAFLGDVAGSVIGEFTGTDRDDGLFSNLLGGENLAGLTYAMEKSPKNQGFAGALLSGLIYSNVGREQYRTRQAKAREAAIDKDLERQLARLEIAALQQEIQQGGKRTAFQKKVQNYMNLYNIDEQTATDLASGFIVAQKDPVSQQVSLVNVRQQATAPQAVPTKAVTPETEATVRADEEDQKEETRQTGLTLWELAPAATGVGATVLRGAETVVGQVPGLGEAVFEQAEPAIAAKTHFDTFAKNLAVTLAVDTRIAEAERKQLEQLATIGSFVSEGKIKTQLKALSDVLSKIKRDQQAKSDDPNLPPKNRGEARNLIAEIDATLTRIGAPTGDVTLRTQTSPVSGVVDDVEWRIE